MVEFWTHYICLVVGATYGFFVCAILSIGREEDEDDRKK